MNFNPRGRTLLFYAVGAGCLIIVILFWFYGYEKTWRLWNIPTMKPYLIDSRVITAGAEAHARGLDPLINNPGSPVMNYPHIWQLLFLLGIDQSDTVYFGITFAGLFFAGVFLVTKEINRPTACLMTGSIFSPAVLLGLERGNNDLVIFFLLALTVYFINKSRIGSGIVIGFAFLLKLYPVFGLVIFLKENKKVFWTIIAIATLICGIYTVVMFNELRLVRSATPRPPAGAYGVDVGWTDLGAHHFVRAAVVFRVVSYLAVIVIAAISLIHAGRRALPTRESNKHLNSFRVGSAVFVGTFLLGGNWDYRLVVLLLVIPQLMDWRRSLSKQLRHVAVITLVCVVIALWDWFIRRLFEHALPVFFLIDLFSKWTVFSGLTYLLIYTLPDWLKHPSVAETELPC